jgi:hypothetical protein
MALPFESEEIPAAEIDEDVQGFLVIAHQVDSKLHIINETRSVFLGNEWPESQADLLAKYMEEGNWYVNITPINQKTVKKLLKARQLVFRPNPSTSP